MALSYQLPAFPMPHSPYSLSLTHCYQSSSLSLPFCRCSKAPSKDSGTACRTSNVPRYARASSTIWPLWAPTPHPPCPRECRVARRHRCRWVAVTATATATAAAATVDSTNLICLLVAGARFVASLSAIGSRGFPTAPGHGVLLSAGGLHQRGATTHWLSHQRHDILCVRTDRQGFGQNALRHLR